MLRRGLIGFVFAAALTLGTAAAEVVVRVAPPPAVVETRPVRPGPHYVWIEGYHRWDGRGYVWVPGEWELPPHPHARWVARHWVRRHGGWVIVGGRWR
ncbi:MAG TPA: hypothetical protein VMI94_11165 [Bryobacteraceae bacterium]|nr:hypothetical protein [Bryobacteraceae bacterium]